MTFAKTLSSQPIKSNPCWSSGLDSADSARDVHNVSSTPCAQGCKV